MEIIMTDTWYYIMDGARQGPVDTQTLQEMVRDEQLHPQHIVWKTGMADWAPAGKMPELFVQAQSPPPIPTIPPIPDAPSGGLMIWRDGNILVMRKEARLPLRCVKTNEPVEQLRKIKMAWHPPWCLLLLLVGLLPFVIVALCLQKKATIMVGFSKSTIRTRRIAIAVGWLGCLTALAIVLAGAVASSGEIALLGLLVFVVTLIYASVRYRVVSPSRIDDYYVYLKGCCTDYLDTFPQLPE